MDFQNDRQLYVISVQSRKGGVGKTTVALNTAHMCSQEFEIVFLDLDITGTELSIIKTNSIWDDLIHFVPSYEKESSSRPINLVSLFEFYMQGQDIPKIGIGINDAIKLKKGKINIFNSNITHNGASGAVKMS